MNDGARKDDPPWLSVLLAVPPGAAGLDQTMQSLERLEDRGWECLLACLDHGAFNQAREACSRRPGLWRPLPPPATGPANALPQAVHQARGEVALLIAPGAAVPGHLPGLLRGLFARDDLAGLGLALQPPSGGGPWAGLAGLELLAHQEDDPLPRLGCAAFRLRAVMEQGGLAPLPGLEALELWLRLQAAGLELDWDEEAYLVLEQPKTLGGLLAGAVEEGRRMFGRRLLLGRRGMRGGRSGEAPQVLLAMVAPCLLVGLWPQAPDRALSLSLLAILLLYPLNRAFMRQVAEYRPGAVGKALAYCLLRPFAWLWGSLRAGWGRLGGGQPGSNLQG